MSGGHPNEFVLKPIKFKPMQTTIKCEIVNKYFEEIYKTSPSNFKYDPIKVPIIRPVNNAHIQERVQQTAITNSMPPMPPRSNLNGRSAATNKAMNKKLVKLPTLRIYRNRRYGSSRSAPKGAILLCHEDRRRQRRSSHKILNLLMAVFKFNLNCKKSSMKTNQRG